MKITVNSLTEVLVDDAPQGGVVDVLFQAAHKGNEEIRAPMLDALIAWGQRSVDEVNTAVSAKLSADASLVEMRAEIDGIRAAVIAARESGDADTTQAIVSDFIKPAQQRKKDAAQAEVEKAKTALSEKQAILDSLK